MIYGSVCSGIEAATVAWHGLGWRAAWYSEIEPFPCAVLQHHYPDTPNLGDMTRIHETETFQRTRIDLLVGGTPCQSFSVAGLRKGLADPRGNLALVFLGLLDRARPRWVVWENVPGVLSSWSDAPHGAGGADEPGGDRDLFGGPLGLDGGGSGRGGDGGGGAFCKRTILTPSSVDFGNSGTVAPGGCLTLSTSEFHSAAAASSLSDILETGALPRRFFLSPMACAGILRRAARRGKELLPRLARALERVAQTA